MLGREVHLLDYFDLNTPVYVGIYARVSTEHEAQINALDNQIQYYDNILKDHPNWVLVDRYIDKGITGTSIKKRPEFLRMVQEAKTGKVNLILTREVSRFARNTVDTLQQVRNLLRYNVAVYFTEDNICTGGSRDDEWELKLSLMATLAQNESKKISGRVKAGQKISFENGVLYGNGNILGYDRVGKDFVVNKEQAATVRRIYELYLSGEGLRRIQYILEQEGHKTAMGKTAWSTQVIRRTLTNPFYYGEIVYRKEYVVDYLEQKKIRNKGEVEQIVVKGKHQPIVTKEEYDRVQEILSSRTRVTTSGKTSGHMISKDVFCRKLKCQCGCTFNKRITYTTKDGEQRFIYQCYTQLNKGSVYTRMKKGLSVKDACTSMTLSNLKLEVTADWIFRRFFANKQLIYTKIMDMLESCMGVDSSMEQVQGSIESCEQVIFKYENKLGALVELYTDGDIPKDMYLSKKEDVESKILKERERLISLKERLNQVQSQSDLEERKRRLADFLAVQAYDKKKRVPEELIDYYVDSIRVDETHMHWILRIPDKEEPKKIVFEDVKKKSKKLTPLTLLEKYVSCETQDRQHSTRHINNEEVAQTLINAGFFNVSAEYFGEVKKYYTTMQRMPRNEDFELEISLLVK